MRVPPVFLRPLPTFVPDICVGHIRSPACSHRPLNHPKLLRGMNYVAILLKGERFDGARFLTPPGPPSCAAAPSPRHALHTTPRPGDRPRPGPGPAAPRPPGHLLPLPICPQRAHAGPIYTRSRPSAPVPFRKLYTSSKVYNKKSRIIGITRYSMMNRRRVPPEA